MSIVDKIIAAVTPPESKEDRTAARIEARALAAPGGWLSMVLDHHEMIEAAFEGVRQAPTAAQRVAAQKGLAALLTGHAMAEEAVLYPALSSHGEKVDAGKAYLEQSMAKVQLALLETIDPMSKDYLEKLEHIRGAVVHHMYEEERQWFPDLMRKAGGDEARLSKRYQEEVNRYLAGSPSMQASM